MAKIHMIDIEPTWDSLWRSVCNGGLNATVLEKAIVLADAVREAQKERMILTFYPNGRVHRRKAKD